jgi:hypothetical protein
MKKSKFYKKEQLKARLINFFKSLLFWQGRKKGVIHTMDITFDNVRAVFFPRDFHEKYHYLGSIPWSKNPSMLKSLVMAMDAEAKPVWCPRWFLRFLHLFGSDNSIVRVRNFFLHNLEKKLTRGIMMWDYKTKWSDYDLRISISAPKHLQDLADAIEDKTYRDGRKSELIEQITKLEPGFERIYMTNQDLENYLDNLSNKDEDFDKLNNKLYSRIEQLIIQWNNDGTKTAGSLTREIVELL